MSANEDLTEQIDLERGPNEKGARDVVEVPTALLERAETGQVDETEFVACVRDSLPYAWRVGHRSQDGWRGNRPRSSTWTTLIRRRARPTGVSCYGHWPWTPFVGRWSATSACIAFQNCHRVVAFRPAAVAGATYAEFISPEAQLRNQSPELRNC